MTQEEFFKRYTYDLDRDYLGGGGFGKVFKAFDNVRDRWVAIKIAEVKPGMEQLSLQKEVELSAQLPEHTNIAHYEACHRFRTPHGVFDFGILQYYSAGNLSELIKSKTLTLSQKESIARGLLEGIGHLHNHNIIHRDLKSSNILIAERNDHTYIPKITDFGLSKMLSDGNQSHFTNSFAGGSLLYVAPEQLAGQTIRKNVDLWSYGVILYELFIGATPFHPNNTSINSERGRAEIVSKISDGTIPPGFTNIPEPWQSIVRKCLVPDSKLRIENTIEIHNILQSKLVSPIMERNVSFHHDNTILIPDSKTEYKAPNSNTHPIRKHKIKFIIAGLTITLGCIIHIVLIRESKAWNYAIWSDSIESYRNYLKRYPIGINSNKARDSLRTKVQNDDTTNQLKDSEYTYKLKNGTYIVAYDVKKQEPHNANGYKEYTGGKWGLFSRSGDFIHSKIYDDIHPISGSDNFLSYTVGDLSGIMRIDGKIISMPLFKWIETDSSNYLFKVTNENWMCGRIFADGKFALPLKYEVLETNDKFTYYAIDGSFKGYINLKGEVILDVSEYECSEGLELGYCIVCKGGDRLEEANAVCREGKCGIITLDKRIILPFLYDFIYFSSIENTVVVNIGGKIGVGSSGLIWYGGGKWGVINLLKPNSISWSDNEPYYLW